MTTETTIKEWLEHMASTNQSSELDSTKMQNLLRRVGFPSARVVLGVVYVEGHGTIEAPPMDIHSVARTLLKSA